MRTREAILSAKSVRVDLARRSFQAGDADHLEYFLATPDALRKTPYLLLLGGKQALRPEAAVLIHEYRVGRFGTRVFSTADMTGRRAVLAPKALRARMAAAAARYLVNNGAEVAHIAFCGSCGRSLGGQAVPPAEAEVAAELRFGSGRYPGRWALIETEIPAYLQLRQTFDETLAHIGQRTRANLRYYRRRCEADLGAQFVPVVSIGPAEFLEFNRRCMYAVPESVARRRYEMLAEVPGAALRGVRDGQGQWLSLVALRRGHGRAELDWQMNREGLPAYSLATVMRSYLIEYEISLGMTRLYIEGGTPQPIGRSFTAERVGELTVCRDSLYVDFLQRFASRLFPRKNYLAQILMHEGLHWRSW